MTDRTFSLFMMASITVAFAAAADLGAGTKAEEMNVPATVMFFIFVATTLGIMCWASKRTKSASDFYTAGAMASLSGFAQDSVQPSLVMGYCSPFLLQPYYLN